MPSHHPPTFPPPWAAAWGDDRHGLWAELNVKGVVQRLRWIEPGMFLMGSEDGEPRAYGDEGPRHRVRLSRGFWLADTACTQALWLAVLGGKNPSRFQGDDRLPVEQVSWDDVNGFLRRLEAAWAEGCTAALPTEAEWEYACRAGSDTAFNTGNALTATQANTGGFDINRKGSTRPARDFRPSRWGLYQMHGNVWEWCEDHWRNYANTEVRGGEVIDPTGPREHGPQALRAMRGGSWFNGASSARSAYRAVNRRDGLYDRLGFRFALRSASPLVPDGA